MARNWIVVAFLALPLGAAAAVAADPVPPIPPGATVTVQANSIWFQDKEMLSRWQQLKRSGSIEDVADYEHEALSHREAWQFINPLAARVLGYDAERGQANVEMQTPGRMQGTTWFLDTAAIER